MAKNNAKKEVKKKLTIKRNIAKEGRSRPKKKAKKTQKRKEKPKKMRKKVEEDSQIEEDEESYEDFILPGQKFSTPPAGDATRAFYESLLEQRPDSVMAKKYCVEYGCLDADKANEYINEMERLKKKRNK